MIRFDTKFLEAESTNMRLLVFFHKSETNQVKLKFRDTFRYWITAPISRHFTWCNILKHNLLFACDRTRTNYVVFHSRGFYNVPRMLIAGPGHFRLWPPSWTDWHTWLPSHAGIDQAALLWISKVRSYDHVYSRWSAKKKPRNSQLENNKTHRTDFSNLWLLLV